MRDILGVPGLTRGQVDTKIATALAGVTAAANPGSVSTALWPLYAAVAARENAPVPIVTLGSSTAAGQGASAAPRQMLNRWVAGLQSDFPLASGATQPAVSDLAANMTLSNGIQHIRGGVGGTRTNDYLDATRAANVAALTPAAIVHIIGSNDYSTGVNPTTARNQLQAWLDDLDGRIGAPHVHVLVHAHRRTDVAAPAFAWSTYGAAWKALAEARSNTVFVDLSTAYRRAGQDATDPWGLLSSDKVHLTDRGHTFGGDLLRATLRLDAPVPSLFTALPDPVDATVPTVTSFVATPGDAQVALTWAGTDNVGVTRWVLARGGTTVYDGAATSFTDTGRTNGTALTYTLRAYDAAGNTSTVSTVSATPAAPSGDTAAPSVPTGLTAGTPTASTVPLSWTASTDNVGVVKYRVRRGAVVVGEPTTTSYTATGLTASTAYSFTVSAVDAAGNESAQSTAATATTAAAGAGPDSALYYAFDSDSVTGLNDGDAVPSWTSTQGSNGTYALTNSTAANQPKWAANQVNGHGALRFVAANQTVLFNTSGSVDADSTDGCAYALVLKVTAASNRMIGTDGTYHLFKGAGGNSGGDGIQFAINTTTGSPIEYGTSVIGRWIVVVVNAFGANSKIVVGTEATVTGTLSTGVGTGLHIGASFSRSGYGSFDIAAMCAYNRALTDSEISTLVSTLKAKYGLS